LPDSNVTKQARYIFDVAKMLRHHVFSSLARVEGESRECVHGDLSLAQMNLILAVRTRGEVTLTELAEILGVSPPSVSVMVERLVERGLLMRERATSDRRKVVIQVSPDEGHHIAEMEERVVATFVELLEELGPSTAGKWHEVLEKVEGVLLKRQSEQGMKSK
jgi:DNA-binding MarR family transcriptional regulator